MPITLGDTIFEPDNRSSGDPVGFAPTGHRISPAKAVAFRVLGPLEVLKGDLDHAPTTPKMLQLFAMLVTHPGKIVHVDSIIHELWADDPPRSVRKTLHTYVHHLRRRIRERQLAVDGEPMLVTRPPGYFLRIDPDQVDVFAFREHCDRGRDLLRRRE